MVWSERPKCSATYSHSSSTSRRRQTSSIIIETFSDIFIDQAGRPPRLHDIVHITTKCHCFVLHTIANDIFSLTSSMSAPQYLSPSVSCCVTVTVWILIFRNGWNLLSFVCRNLCHTSKIFSAFCSKSEHCS